MQDHKGASKRRQRRDVRALAILMGLSFLFLLAAFAAMCAVMVLVIPTLFPPPDNMLSDFPVFTYLDKAQTEKGEPTNIIMLSPIYYVWESR